jgi:uncharacterized protein with HEPN domain
MKTAEYKLHIAEILKAATRIEEHTRGLSREDFPADRARVAAVGDDLVRIGRAVERIPDNIRRRYPAIDWEAWPAAAGAGDAVLWDAATRHVPAFGRQVSLMLLDITD